LRHGRGGARRRAVLAVAARTGWGGLWGLALPFFLFVSATGLIVANSIAGALAGFPERAGAASALVGAVQYGGGIVGSALVGAFADGTPWPMGCVVACAGIGSLLCTRLLVPPRTRLLATAEPVYPPFRFGRFRPAHVQLARRDRTRLMAWGIVSGGSQPPRRSGEAARPSL
jgi:DHA1 family bicyclomycin/chloramphenicol resistance-like MFS transporter